MLGKNIVADEFTRITGLAAEIRYPAGGVIELAPRNHEHKNSFVVRAEQRQRRLTVEFAPGTFAGHLVHAMGEADEDGRRLWQSQVEDLTGLRCSIVMVINGSPVDAGTPAVWPRDWRFLQLTLTRNLVARDTGDLEDGLLPASYWFARFAALLVALLPLEAAAVEQLEPDTEGDPLLVRHWRYERSPRNRQAAIAIHGFACHGCTTNMEHVYGELGREFIHIHHVTPLSLLDKPVPVDPAKDLIPLCPNCHAIVHRRSPPYTLEELRKALGRS
jgi:5-methylcytosine-specific restriction enzyme A